MAYAWGYIIGYLINGIIFGFITKYVAESKGYEGGFWWGFWLGLIGLLVVGFRPNIQQQSNTTEYKPMYGGALEKPAIPTWTCACGSKNSSRLDTCPICRRKRGENTVGLDIKCPKCGAMNNPTRTVCVLCDTPLKEEYKPNNNNQKSESVNQQSPTDLLETLGKLHQQGVLTDEEFQQKKADILAKL